HVKSFASEPDRNDDVDYTWSVDVPTILDDHDVMVTVPTDEYDLVTRMATATHVIHRLHGMADSLLDGTYTMRLYHPRDEYDVSPNDVPASWLQGRDEIAIHRAHAKNKFIMGHEIGHWIQFQVAGEIWKLAYEYPPPPNTAEPPCLYCVFADWNLDRCGNPLYLSSTHGMRSAEYSSFAMTEGFAHFIAASAYNDILEEDGIFK